MPKDRNCYAFAKPDGAWFVGRHDYNVQECGGCRTAKSGVTYCVLNPSPKSKEGNPAIQAIRLAQKRDELFACPEGNPFVTYEINGQREAKLIDDEMYGTVLRRHYFNKYKDSIKPAHLKQALAELIGIAKLESKRHEVHIRTAEAGGAYYIDLADDQRQVVRVTPGNWEIIAAPDGVRFRRPDSMQALPVPVKGGSIDLLRQYVNVRSEDFPLVVGWAIGALRPGANAPCPELAFTGQGGSAKTFNVRVLQKLIDPNGADVRGEPKDIQDLMLHAHNCLLPAFDNFGKMDQSMSDALCRIITGAGFGSRKLYTNLGEIVFKVRRPVIMSSVREVITAPDLLDRTIMIDPPYIDDAERKGEAELWEGFDRDKPAIFGALLDGLAAGLKKLPNVRLTNLPRMADFAKFVTAAESAYDFEPLTILKAFVANQNRAALAVIESSPLAQALIPPAKEGFEGSAKELAAKLGEGDWSENPQALRNEFVELLPALSKTGVTAKSRILKGHTVWQFAYVQPALALYGVGDVDPLIPELLRLAPILSRVGVRLIVAGDRVSILAA